MAKAQAGVHGKTNARQNAVKCQNTVKKNSRFPISIHKKVTFAEPSNAKPKPEHIGLDSGRSLDNITDEPDDLKNNSLSDDKNLMFQMAALSQLS